MNKPIILLVYEAEHARKRARETWMYDRTNENYRKWWIAEAKYTRLSKKYNRVMEENR